MPNLASKDGLSRHETWSFATRKMPNGERCSKIGRRNLSQTAISALRARKISTQLFNQITLQLLIHSLGSPPIAGRSLWLERETKSPRFRPFQRNENRLVGSFATRWNPQAYHIHFAIGRHLSVGPSPLSAVYIPGFETSTCALLLL